MSDLTIEKLAHIHARDVRQKIREGKWTKPTSGAALGHAQANMIILPRDWAYDFLLYATRNPKPCPILDVCEAGDAEPKMIAPGADIRTDLPKYRVWENGKLVDEPTDIKSIWRDDLVAFMIGCSFSFENALILAGIRIRHIDMGVNVPMYLTGVKCVPAGRFSGNMVMSMRPVPHNQVVKAVTTTARYPSVHGAPIHIGNPEAIGVKDIDKPEFGDPVEIREGEVPIFWACGVTPQAAVMQSKPPFAITHAPGHMFIADKTDADYEVF
jgi:uncharacterized protein YcsI (UPF0317 family)